MLTLPDLIETVRAEYVRVTGAPADFKLQPWWAARQRELIDLQVDDIVTEGDRMIASARWGRLTKKEQQERLIAYLKGLPTFMKHQEPPQLVLRKVA